MTELQNKILEIMLFIDQICKKYNIKYYVMGGTALGAVRHGGFIPWDDDIDIFMIPEEYQKFKKNLLAENDIRFELQEWKITDDYVEFAKVRMNGTTFIEKNLVNRRDIHQGIFVDIMMLHKIPAHKTFLLKKQYLLSKYLALKGNLQRGWNPQKKSQFLLCKIAKIIPQFIDKRIYKKIYKYDSLKENYDYIYYITKANLQQGYFSREIFDNTCEVLFEGYKLSAPCKIEEYLKIRYGDYMQLPPAEEQKSAQHAVYWSTKQDFRDYFKKIDEDINNQS